MAFGNFAHLNADVVSTVIIIGVPCGEQHIELKIVCERNSKNRLFFRRRDRVGFARICQGEGTFGRAIGRSDHHKLLLALFTRLIPHGIQRIQLTTEFLVISDELRIDTRIELDIRHRHGVTRRERFHRFEVETCKAVGLLVSRSREAMSLFIHAVSRSRCPICTIVDNRIIIHIDVEDKFVFVGCRRHANFDRAKVEIAVINSHQLTVIDLSHDTKVTHQGDRLFGGSNRVGAVGGIVHGKGKAFHCRNFQGTRDIDLHRIFFD